MARLLDGATLQPAQMPGRANSTIWNFAVNHADPDLAYATSVSGQVYRSTDGGISLGKAFGRLVWGDSGPGVDGLNSLLRILRQQHLRQIAERGLALRIVGGSAD